MGGYKRWEKGARNCQLQVDLWEKKHYSQKPQITSLECYLLQQDLTLRNESRNPDRIPLLGPSCPGPECLNDITAGDLRGENEDFRVLTYQNTMGWGRKSLHTAVSPQ